MSDSNADKTARLSFRAYAKLRGLSPEAVSKAVRLGRIRCHTDEDGVKYLIQDEADKDWEENTDKAFQRKDLDEEELERREPEISVEGSTYSNSRALRESYQAKIARLEYEKLSGSLVPIEEVKAEAFKLSRTVRDAILNIPDRISAQLAAESDQHKVYSILTDELTRALEELVGNAQKRK